MDFKAKIILTVNIDFEDNIQYYKDVLFSYARQLFKKFEHITNVCNSRLYYLHNKPKVILP